MSSPNPPIPATATQQSGSLSPDAATGTLLTIHERGEQSTTSTFPQPGPSSLASANRDSLSTMSNTQSGNSSAKPAIPAATWTTRQHMRDFFKWKPAEYDRAQDHGRSCGTRGPRRFDLHMHEGLRMKKVVVLKDMVQVLSRLGSDYLRDRQAPWNFLEVDLSEKDFPHPKYRDDISKMLPQITQEGSLAYVYKLQTGTFCSITASNFIFKLPAWKKVLKWRTKPDTPQRFAIADGFLSISDKEIACLSTEDKLKVEAIKRHGLDNFVLWEFKSLTAGTENIMKALGELEGDFEWITCHSVNDVELSDKEKCDHTQHVVNGRWAVTGSRVGPDAKDQWIIDACLRKETQAKTGSSQSEPSSQYEDAPLVGASESTAPPTQATTSQTNISVPAGRQPAKGSKKGLRNGSAKTSTQQKTLKQIPATSPMDKAKLGEKKKGRHILQQDGRNLF